MDSIRVTKVDGVLCSKSGKTLPGTVHLTAHHLIFAYDDKDKEELWVPYPLMSLVTRMPHSLQGKSPITFRTRSFETFTLSFEDESNASDVFDSVRDLTVATSVTQLYAFHYVPNPPFSSANGWSLYSAREEFGRMGVGTRTKAWRFTDINKDYSFCSTYPAKLVVPTRISDTTLQYALKYRSKGRLPVLTYLHWANYGTLTRSSQPMVGITQSRSIQDEKLVEAIFQSHHSPDSRASSGPVYGATATNIIIDARPTTNAVANTAKGAGTENMDNYKEARKAYLGIDNIHTMRDSLAKVVDALRETELVASTLSGDLPGESATVPILDRQALRRSGWLRHLSAIMEGTLLIVKNVHVNSSHVLIHCSDGWDRTAQLSALSQICLDPYYRTVKGFQVLVEKDWMSFGHKFLDRCGHLSSEKFFVSPPADIGSSASGAEAAQAFFASVQNKFASQKHIQETSPVFHQFLESVRQVQRQFPERFEFNERFLRQLHYHLYCCQFGNFLFNSEKERKVGENGRVASECTVSIWDFFNSPPERELNLNPDYNPSLDDTARREPGSDQGVLIINPKDVRFWYQLYGRTDEEMNGKFVVRQVMQNPELLAPLEISEDDPAVVSIHTPPQLSGSPSPLAMSEVSETLTPMISAVQRTVSPAPSSSSRTRHDSLMGLEDDLSSKRGRSSPLPRSPSPRISRLQASSRAPPSPRGTTTELFSSTSVRSMWGRFSSGASAAISAVQDAYGGMAKDFGKLSVGGADSGVPTAEGGGELKSREEINAWGTIERSSESRLVQSSNNVYSSGSGATINPWSTTKTRPGLSSMFLDNPWETPESPTIVDSLNSPLRPSSTIDPSRRYQESESSELPRDPTVALPKPIPVPRNQTLSLKTASSSMTLPSELGSFTELSTWARSDSSGRPSANSTPPLPPAPPPPPPPQSSDPLGVGPL
ncbi:protein-tyrosine phosphatase-like protein [Irpex rosettiformis]|uniref:Protein-tyrosine phosphatase-like protein n=1 Tax=Irpex rosettiformis TaxID=378272 RepID=A0ACB8TWR8_9APHY|nr:protein-tyrosine phosphatase-like protein [Irpex rosettiformis]